MHIAAGQIRAARGMLDWSREELAQESGLSHNTIRSIEAGNISRRDTMEAVRRAFEGAGIRFTEEDGIRRERMDLKVIKGAESCDRFFDTLLEMAKRKGGEVIGLFKSQEMMTRSLGIQNKKQLDRLDTLKNYAGLRCVFSDKSKKAQEIMQCSTRLVPDYCISNSFFVYGNRYALVYRKGSDDFYFVLHNDVELACYQREHFEILWNIAESFQNVSAFHEQMNAHSPL